jgi:hypothetical protein
MATKDITDLQVCQAVRAGMDHPGPYDGNHHRHVILAAMTGEHLKVCWRALERAQTRDLIDCGVGLHVAYLTDAGKALLGDDA